MVQQIVRVGGYRITIIVMLDGSVEIIVDPPPAGVQINR